MLGASTREEFLVFLVLLALLIVPLVLSLALAARIRRRRFVAWAASHGLAFFIAPASGALEDCHGDAETIQGLWQGRPVRCECVEKPSTGSGGHQQDWLLVSVTLSSPLPGDLTIERGMWLERLPSGRRWPVATADHKFDITWNCHAVDPDTAVAFLNDAGLRRALKNLDNQVITVRVAESRLDVVRNAGAHTRKPPVGEIAGLFDALVATDAAITAAAKAKSNR